LLAKLSAGPQPLANKKTRETGFIKMNNEISLEVDAVFKSNVFVAVTISLGRCT